MTLKSHFESLRKRGRFFSTPFAELGSTPCGVLCAFLVGFLSLLGAFWDPGGSQSENTWQSEARLPVPGGRKQPIQ